MNSISIINSSYKGDVILTIAIPTFRRFDLLKETLKSVFSLKFNIPIEIIIVDNDPENLELALLEMSVFKNNDFTYYKNIKNYGMFNNWNQCLNLGKGKLITILHDDDLLCTNFPYELEHFLDIYESYDNIPLIGFGHYLLEQRDNEDKVKKNTLYKVSKLLFNFYNGYVQNEKIISITLKEMLWGNKFSGTLGVVMDRDKALSISGFDAKLYPVSDYDFWIRWIQKYGEIKYKNTKIAYYRVRNNESMKPEVISEFINKSFELRMKVIKETKSLYSLKNNIVDLKNLEEYSYNVNWGKKNNYQLSVLDTINYIYLKIKLIIYRYIIR
ncbi:TPA: glycosyltransferase [Yersinia enterocolitica]